MLSLNEYQKLAAQTNKMTLLAVERQTEYGLCWDAIPSAYNTLGLVGEAGEFADKVKKIARDGTYDRSALAKELGDVLWYLSQLAGDLNYSLEEIAVMNLDKIRGRTDRGTLHGSGDDR